MGNAAEGVLFYGFPLPEEPELFNYWDWENRYLTAAGYPAEPSPALTGKAWRDGRLALLADARCVVEARGYSDACHYFVAAKASILRAEWSESKPVPESPPAGPVWAWERPLQAFCAKLGIPWQAPGWYLTSYYG